MAHHDIAPYATAHTSVLVYKGKGILVKRADSRDVSTLISAFRYALAILAHVTMLTSFMLRRRLSQMLSASSACRPLQVKSVSQHKMALRRDLA